MLGRKTSLMIQNCLVFCSLVAMGLSSSATMLLIARSIHGYAYGAITAVVPIYNSEICQPQMRDFTGTLATSVYTSSVSLVFILGALLPWRQLVLVCALAPLTDFILLFFVPESPSWYVLNHRVEDARETLNKLRGNEHVANRELSRMLKNLEKLSNQVRESDERSKVKILLEFMREGTFTKPLLATLFITVLGQNLSGLTALGLYMTKILFQANVPANPYWIAAGLMSFRFCTCLSCSFYVPYIKRKTLHSVGVGVMALGNVILGVSLSFDMGEVFGSDSTLLNWIPVLGIAVLYFGFGAGQGHAQQCFTGELFPAFGRALGVSILGLADGLFLFLIGKSLPALDAAIGLGNMFFCFASMCILVGILVIFFVPETRGKSLEEIEEHYRITCYGEDYDFDTMSKHFDRLSVYDNQSLAWDLCEGSTAVSRRQSSAV